MIPELLGLHNLDEDEDNDDGFIDGDGGRPQYDDSGNILSIEHDDGSITVSLGDKPLIPFNKKKLEGWFRNLADEVDDISHGELNKIASNLLRLIREDDESRSVWLANRARAIKILGLTGESANGQSGGTASDGLNPREIVHPIFLNEAVSFQATVSAELLPEDGPLKVRNDETDTLGQPQDKFGQTVDLDALSDCLEKDMNHFLTVTATEYRPETDRMFLMGGATGSGFQKIYYSAIKNRPTIENVDPEDLIISNEATDMRSAERITHRTRVSPNTIRMFQLMDIYRDVYLPPPNQREKSPVDAAKEAVDGISRDLYYENEDAPRDLYECHCYLDLKGFEHKYKGKISGFKLPYKVTIDITSQEVLAVVRNFDDDKMEFPISRQEFVKFPFIPGLGFYDLGLFHLLNNATTALTLSWRILLEAGDFANFPGMIGVKGIARDDTNIHKVNPGTIEWIETSGMPIRDAIMPIPYPPPSPAFISFLDNVAQNFKSVSMSAQQVVGDGSPNIPVGTVLALIEQHEKILNSVHKRYHSAQKDTFEILFRCFRENPESFWQSNNAPTRQWDEQTFLRALDEVNLVPRADPNTSSRLQRMAKVQILGERQKNNPALYDPMEVEITILRETGFPNPERFFAAPQPQQGPNAADISMQAMTQAKMSDSHAKMMMAQAKMQETKVKMVDSTADAQNRAEDRTSREKVEMMKLLQEQAMHPEQAPGVSDEISRMIQPILMQNKA